MLADLLELVPDGVEEIEPAGVEGGEDFIEYAVYGAPGELPDLPDLQAVAGGALVEISTSEVPDDWSERWKRFHRPVLVVGPIADRDMEDATVSGACGIQGADLRMVAEGDVYPEADLRARVGPSLFVRPPWEAPSVWPGSLEVVIDPAQAFGTGAHATTRLCLELLLELAGDGARGPVLDVGAGSGVLAIAAAKLGYGPVLALDNDRESVAAIADNAARNGVQLEARRFDLRRDALPRVDGVQAPIVLANLLRPLLLELAETMPVWAPPVGPTLPTGLASSAAPTSRPASTSSAPPTSRPASTSFAPPTSRLASTSRAAPTSSPVPTSPHLDLIASGLLCEQADEVAQAFAMRLGLRERARREQGEWAALWLTSAPLPRAPSP